MHNMRKYPIIFFAAAAALAACTKTEVIPVENDTLAEITYETAPVTKAPKIDEFTKGNVFASYAYYHTADWAWDNTPVLYIGTEDAKGAITPATISWVSSTTVSGSGVWKDAIQSYYWPKKAKLSFFAWSLNKSDLNFPVNGTTGVSSASVSCYPSSGICLMNFDVKENKNIDFLVAEPSLNKTKNDDSKYFTEGVPTLFKHKLSLMNVTVKVKDAEYEKNGITFTLNSIVFNKVQDGIGFYMQYNNGSESITTSGSTSTQTYTSTDQKVDKTTPTSVTDVDQYIYIPQSFTNDNQTVTITYTVNYDTNGDKIADVTETIPVTKKLSEFTGNWEMGKKYTINITFALDEILWDPAVEDWTSVEQTVSIQ